MNATPAVPDPAHRADPAVTTPLIGPRELLAGAGLLLVAIGTAVGVSWPAAAVLVGAVFLYLGIKGVD